MTDEAAVKRAIQALFDQLTEEQQTNAVHEIMFHVNKHELQGHSREIAERAVEILRGY